jgi:hypothetical protein
MLCLMLRQLPASQARDLRVLLVPVLQDSEHGTRHYSKLSSFLLLDSLGISLKDIKDWTKFISLCDEVTLKDNPIGQQGLETLRESIRSLSRRSKVPYSTTNTPQGDQANGMAPQGKTSFRLRKFQLAMATPVPFNMGLTLAGMAFDLAFDQALSCSLPGGIEFNFASIPLDKDDSKLLERQTPWTWLERDTSFVNKDVLNRAFSLLQQKQLDELWRLLCERLKGLETREVIDIICIVGILWVS